MDGFSDNAFEFSQGSVYGFRSWCPVALPGDHIYPYFRSFKQNEVLSDKFAMIGVFGGKWFSKEMTATCNSHSFMPVPYVGCACGIYAYWHETHSGCITGVIEGFGKTLIGDLGFRTEHARIKALCSSPMFTVYGSRRISENCVLPAGFLEHYEVPLYTNIDDMIANHPLTNDYLGICTPSESRRDSAEATEPVQ